MTDEIENGRAGTQGRRTYGRSELLTVTAHDEYFEQVETVQDIVNDVEELLDSCEFVMDGEESEEIVETTLGEARVRFELSPEDNRTVAISAGSVDHNTSLLGLTLRDPERWQEAYDEVNQVVTETADWNNARLRLQVVDHAK